MIGGGVGGLFAGIMGLAEYAIVSPGLAAILAFVPSDGSFYNLFIALATIAISFAVAFAATWFLGFEEEMPV
jgi:PTS system beta-glucosides-specific IIC component